MLIIKIGKQIDGMENLTYSRLLHLRYLTGLSLCKIADRLYYSYDYVRELHGHALQAFGDKYLK